MYSLESISACEIKEEQSIGWNPGGRVHNMLKVQVCAAHMGGLLGRNSLNKGPFFGRFSINMGGLSRNRRQKATNGSFSAKIHHKSGYDSKVR